MKYEYNTFLDFPKYILEVHMISFIMTMITCSFMKFAGNYWMCVGSFLFMILLYFILFRTWMKKPIFKTKNDTHQ